MPQTDEASPGDRESATPETDNAQPTDDAQPIDDGPSADRHPPGRRSRGLTKLLRWTPLMFAFPRFYLEESEFWADLSFEDWSDEEYEWTEDAWNGLRDFVQTPRTTYETCRGDCEDYALLSACVLVSRGRTNLHFAMVTSSVLPEHFVLYDAERERVYSSGVVHEKTFEEYVADSRYERSISRRIA